MKYCTKCGEKNPDEAKFCSKCGNPFVKKENHIPEEAKKEVYKQEAIEKYKDSSERKRVIYGSIVFGVAMMAYFMFEYSPLTGVASRVGSGLFWWIIMETVAQHNFVKKYIAQKEFIEAQDN